MVKRYVNRAEREEKLLDLIQNQKFTNPSRLAEELGVSIVTIRRDLKNLEKQGLIIKSYNTIKIRKEFDKRFYERLSQNIEKKQLIAKLAQKFVQPGDTLFIDTSTTCYELSRVLSSSSGNIHVVTNSIISAVELSNNHSIEVTLIGGTLKNGYFSNVGAFAEEMVEKIKFEKIFFSCAALDEEGLYEPSTLEGNFKKRVLNNANKKYLLVDSSKFNKASIFKTSRLEGIDVIITDCTPPDSYIKILKSSGIRLVVPEKIYKAKGALSQ